MHIKEYPLCIAHSIYYKCMCKDRNLFETLAFTNSTSVDGAVYMD